MVSTERGFTIIEIVITLAVLGIVLAAAVPMTMSWAKGAHVQRAESTLLQGYRHAKALAVRNPQNISKTSSPNDAASLKLSNGLLLVCAGAASSCTSSTATWQGTVPSTSTITLNGTANTWTLGIDNTGIPTSAAGYAISEGSENASGTLL